MSKQLSLIFFLLLTSDILFSQAIVDTTLPDLIPYRKGNLWGYCDKSKVMKINPQFLYARPFVNSFAEVRIDSTTEGVINNEGQVIVRVGKDTTVWVSDNDIIYVQLENEVGIIKLREANGDWVSMSKNRINKRLAEGLYVIRKGRWYGVVNKSGKIILPVAHKEIYGFDERKITQLIKRNDKTVFVDSSLKRTVLKMPKKYSVGSFHSDLAKISLAKNRHSLVGFINRNGEVVIPMRYKKAGIFIDGICEVSNETKTGFINSKGDTVISFKYGSPIVWGNGYINYRQMLSSKLYDLNDKEIIKAKAHDIEYVNDSLIVISKYGSGQMPSLKYGIIDITGKEIWLCTSHSIYTNLYPGLIYVLEKWAKQPYYMDYKFNKYYED